MPGLGIKELLEAGVHFGHQTRRWNPKMRPVHLTASATASTSSTSTRPSSSVRAGAQLRQRDRAAAAARSSFVGTKKQAQDVDPGERGGRSGMHYVNHRWLGGHAHELPHDLASASSTCSDLERHERPTGPARAAPKT